MVTGGYICSAFSPLMHWDLLFRVLGFEGCCEIAAVLNSNGTQPDTFRKDFCIANTTDSTVHVDGMM
jgi:hypothetical protein